VKVKLDENLPASLGDLFVPYGHDVDTVIAEDLVGHPDSDLAAAALAEGRLLITLDKGFGDIRAYPPGTHPGILVLRLADDLRSRSVRPSPKCSPITASTTWPAP
jgi:predicted nuclease of predicted toxin-antitoxin system